MFRISKKSDYAIFLLSCLVRREGELVSCSTANNSLRGSPQRDHAPLAAHHTAARGASAGRPSSELAAEESRHSSRSQLLRSAAELAELSGLSKSVVANLLKEFTKSGMLGSVRGKNGGYRLLRDPAGIRLREILEVVEGRLALVDCATHTSKFMLAESAPRSAETRDTPALASQIDCELSRFCPSRSPLLAIHRRILEMLDGTSLLDLCQPVRFPVLEVPQEGLVGRDSSECVSKVGPAAYGTANSEIANSEIANSNETTNGEHDRPTVASTDSDSTKQGMS